MITWQVSLQMACLLGFAASGTAAVSIHLDVNKEYTWQDSVELFVLGFISTTFLFFILIQLMMQHPIK